MFDSIKKVWNDSVGSKVIAGIILLLVGTAASYLLANSSINVSSLILVALSLLAAYGLWKLVVAPIYSLILSSGREQELADEQLKIIDYLYVENRLCAQDELAKVGEITRNQKAILLISRLCEEGYLRRIKGKRGLAQKNPIGGERTVSPSVPLQYGLTNKGRELGEQREDQVRKKGR